MHSTVRWSAGGGAVLVLAAVGAQVGTGSHGAGHLPGSDRLGQGLGVLAEITLMSALVGPDGPDGPDRPRRSCALRGRLAAQRSENWLSSRCTSSSPRPSAPSWGRLSTDRPSAWAYHAVAPHVWADAPLMVRIFGLR